MLSQAFSIRPFVGAKDFAVSRSFYGALGFTEQAISPVLSYFALQNVGFYLQDAYVPDWVDNTMLFLQVADVERQWADLAVLDLPNTYKGVRIIPVRQEVWGKVGFIHDPAGNLWHVGELTKG